MQVEFEGPSRELLLEQLRATQREWLSIPCYGVSAYAMSGGASGSPTDCGFCHICVRREALRQVIEAADKGGSNQ